jgi:hypothetical protein
MLVDALLPNQLDKRAEDAHRDRGFGLRLTRTAPGWRITAGSWTWNAVSCFTRCWPLSWPSTRTTRPTPPATSSCRDDGWRSGG